MQAPRPPLLTRGFALILGMQTLFGASQACYALLPKFLATELDASAPQIGSIAAMYSVAVVLLVPVVGMGLDRHGRRIFLLVGYVLSLVGALAFVWVDQISPVVYLLRALQGAGFACAFISANALVADLAPQRLGQAIALLSATMHGTAAVVPLAVELSAESFGWAPVFVAAALCSAGAGLLAFAVPVPRQPARAPGAPRAGMGEVLRRPAAWRAFVITSMVGIAVAAVMVFIQPYALERGVARIAPFLLTFSAVAMALRVFGGGWLDRIDRHRVTVASVAGYVLLLFLVPNMDLRWLVPLGALFGIAHGAFFPVFNAMGLQGTDGGERGRAVAVLNGSFNVGFAAGNFGLGHAAAAWGYGSVFGIAGAGMTVALLLLLGVRGSGRWSLAAHRPAAEG